jgi:GT2 family glycosyltransferase
MIVLSVMKMKIAIIVPSWNGIENISACLDSLLRQTEKAEIIVVENGSIDDSLNFLQKNYPNITLLEQKTNLGFAGGVNVGIRYAIESGFEFVALFNNDAIADSNWLNYLVEEAKKRPDVGIVTGKLLKSDEITFDSTGDQYTSWGLPYPRGRGEKDKAQYDNTEEVFAASGGASLYRVAMLKEVGLFDEDFFAYYEDVDLSFRAQLAGWKVLYAPKARAYHQIGGTSSKIKGFTTYQFLKNIPYVYWKNVPLSLAIPMFPRIFIAYWSIVASSLAQGKIVPTCKGVIVSHIMLWKKLYQRHKIQKNRKVTVEYIGQSITPGLPPNADKLRKLSGFLRLK